MRSVADPVDGTSVMAQRRPVVVGLDESAHGRLALTWAVEEAVRRGRPLHLLHAGAEAPTSGSATATATATATRPASALTQSPLMERAVARVHDLAPDLEVTTELSQDSASRALLAASTTAFSVVVGSRGRGALVGAVLGTTSAAVAAGATCPVVVVRRPARVEPERPRVVVGVDGSELSTAAVGYAFAQAALRGVPLTVVHACPTRAGEGYVPPWRSDDPAATVAAEHAATAEEMAGWSGLYPDVRVRRHVLRADPVTALVDHSRGAELLVVGSRGFGGVSGRLVGSVSQAVLNRAHCPVAVVRSATR